MFVTRAGAEISSITSHKVYREDNIAILALGDCRQAFTRGIPADKASAVPGCYHNTAINKRVGKQAADAQIVENKRHFRYASGNMSLEQKKSVVWRGECQCKRQYFCSVRAKKMAASPE